MAVVLAGVMLGVASSNVAASTTGAGAFGGVVGLPSFPCTNCAGGTFAGSATIVLSGLAMTSLSGVPLPYTAAWEGQPNNASAAFSFDESCIPEQPGATPPLVGSATGTFAVSGGTLSIAGGSFLSATLSGTLNWLRVGTGAQLALSALTITAPAGGSTVAVNLTTNLVGESPTAFVWTNGPGTCGATQPNQTAMVEGVPLVPV